MDVIVASGANHGVVSFAKQCGVNLTMRGTVTCQMGQRNQYTQSSFHRPLNGPPITGDQVQMLKTDNIVSPGAKTLADLGVTNLETVESVVPTYLWRHRPHGQFQPPRVDETSRVDA